MKPRFLLTTALLALFLMYIPVDASFRMLAEKTSNIKSEQPEIRPKTATIPPIDHSTPEERHPMMAGKGTAHQKGEGHHGEEDGKHHEFHLDLLKKRVKRFCNVICFLTKFFLAITHICILICVFKSVIAH